MNLCSDGHDEICYEGRNCPCCAMLSDIAARNSEIDGLRDEIKSLENEIA